MNEWKIGDPNRTFSYVLPMIGDTVLEFRGKIFPQSYYRNCFIANEDLPEKDSHIFLLYKFSGKTEFIEYEARLLQYPNCIGSYDPDTEHVMFIFEIPDKWKADFELFKQSRYSEMSARYKKHIMNFHDLKPQGPIAGTLYRKEFRYKQLEEQLGIDIPRDQEASSVLDMSVETFSLEMLPKTGIKEIEGKEF
jgi:hypothetical protein